MPAVDISRAYIRKSNVVVYDDKSHLISRGVFDENRSRVHLKVDNQTARDGMTASLKRKKTRHV